MERLTDSEYKEIYSKTPRACVDVLIKTNSGGTIFSRRAYEPEKDKWHIPGGTLYKGESYQEAAERIAHEELGAKVKAGEVLTATTYFNNERHDVIIAVEAQLLDSSLSPNPDDTTAVSEFFEIPADCTDHNIVYERFIK